MSTTLSDFLLARIAEDEATRGGTRKLGDFYGQPCPSCGEIVETIGSPWDESHELRVEHDPLRTCYLTREQVEILMPDRGPTEEAARVLAECEAKRRIVERWVAIAERTDDSGRPAHLFDPVLSMLLKSHERDLLDLASVYVDHPDHPDYREEWLP